MTRSENNFRIAGKYRVNHWRSLREKLLIDNDSENKYWAKAFRIFEVRVITRFLDPIDAILNMHPSPKRGKGEGFSAVALQCILIEFFESFYQGKIYVYDKNKNNSSKSLYTSFLKNRSPFSNFFNTNRNWAGHFYEDVRCGLLHGAATKDRVIIRTVEEKDGKIVDINYENIIKKDENGDVILYRNAFQKALKKYLQNYEKELMSCSKLKKAFYKKMDELCQI